MAKKHQVMTYKIHFTPDVCYPERKEALAAIGDGKKNKQVLEGFLCRPTGDRHTQKAARCFDDGIDGRYPFHPKPRQTRGENGDNKPTKRKPRRCHTGEINTGETNGANKPNGK